MKAIINCDWCTVRHVLRAMVFPEWNLTGLGTQKKVLLSRVKGIRVS